MEFHKASYEKHKHRIDSFANFKIWSRQNSVDIWRHQRMYVNLEPLIKLYPKAKWLTVGDGRFGTDAHYLETHGIDVLSTDLSADNLKIAKKEGFIKNYKAENAECLTFEDDSFDFVLCKESYHHFPRPIVGLYEMIRVARKGVILIEPNDANISTPRDNYAIGALNRLWQAIKNELKRLARKDIYYKYGNYEESGNYVYTISEREIEKVALGIDLPTVAFKGLDDFYIKGVENELLTQNGPLKKKVTRMIQKAERKSKLHLKNYGLLVAIVFTSAPDLETILSIEKQGFRISNLPRNPFIRN